MKSKLIHKNDIVLFEIKNDVGLLSQADGGIVTEIEYIEDGPVNIVIRDSNNSTGIVYLAEILCVIRINSKMLPLSNG